MTEDDLRKEIKFMRRRKKAWDESFRVRSQSNRPSFSDTLLSDESKAIEKERQNLISKVRKFNSDNRANISIKDI